MSLKLIQWNLRGYRSRIPHLQQLLDNLKPDILCLHETWLQGQHQLKLSFFQELIRKDRVTKGGGVMIGVRQGIPFFPVTIQSELEVCAVQVSMDNRKINIASIYLPPEVKHEDIQQELDKVINSMCSPVMLCIDANAHHASWGSPFSDKRGHLVDAWITD